ncbi:MAG: 3-deoxy-7-phosphoheptulonate synthase [Planctomycetes bacterium]|nr:3-deoxy-7-phosphoheptulonate synthase [Planctomycetota bacterium]
MLLRLRKNLSRAELEAVLGLARELGYGTRFLDGGREILALDGVDGGPEPVGAPDHRARFEDLAAVSGVLDAGESHELFERGEGRADTVVRVGDAAFGGKHISLVAGPCAIEDFDSALEIARAVRERGATCLRGGAFKPRTSPYSFQGARAKGLEILAQVKLATGLAVVTEVLDPRDVAAVGQVADMFQIGSRNMQNSALLIEVGKAKKPVLLKRGFAATLREFLLAAEYVLAQGNEQVVLCERGIRGFDPSTRNVLDVGAVAYLKRLTHLPVVVDPSHASGRSELVRPLSRAGLAAGADGLIVEVHPHPEFTHSDGEQAIDLEEFRLVAADARAIAALDGREVVAPRTQGAKR